MNTKLSRKELELITERLVMDISTLKAEVLLLSNEKSLLDQWIWENRKVSNDLNNQINKQQQTIEDNKVLIQSLEKQWKIAQQVLEIKTKELNESIKLLEDKLSQKRLAIEEINKIKPIDYWPLNKSLEEEITKKRTILQTIESTIWEKNKILSALEEKSKGIVKDLVWIEEMKTQISRKERDVLIREKRVFRRRFNSVKPL